MMTNIPRCSLSRHYFGMLVRWGGSAQPTARSDPCALAAVRRP